MLWLLGTPFRDCAKPGPALVVLDGQLAVNIPRPMFLHLLLVRGTQFEQLVPLLAQRQFAQEPWALHPQHLVILQGEITKEHNVAGAGSWGEIFGQRLEDKKL